MSCRATPREALIGRQAIAKPRDSEPDVTHMAAAHIQGQLGR